jgi:arylsulfatase A-like enzyme
MKPSTKLLPLLTGLILLCGFAFAAGARKPNILFFYADDMGYHELGCYGNPDIRSPNIDSIAKNGIRFTQGYVSAPSCSPSRAGLMTGRYQTRFGHENNHAAAVRGLPLTETTLANRLKSLGYATGIAGKWHLGSTPEYLPMKRGFDEYYGVTANPGSYFQPEGFINSRLSAEPRPAPGKDFYTTDAFADWAVDWIGRHQDGPWFLYLPFNAIHNPLEATDKYLQRYAHLSDPRQRTLAAVISAMDAAVGRVLARVKELGQEQDTLVFFISDNGPTGPQLHNRNKPLRGQKNTTWEGGIRVPFMMQWPGKLPAGQVSDTPVIQLDVMPTCVVAAGGTVDSAWSLDGVDLMPFLTGTAKGRPHQTFCWRIDGMWAVRDGDWKLVHGRADHPPPELFNLANDVSEQNNLASAQPEKVQTLKALWDAWNARQATTNAAKDQSPKRGKGKKRKGSPATAFLPPRAVAGDAPTSAPAVNAPINRILTGLVWKVGKNHGTYLTGPEIETVLDGNPHLSCLFISRVWSDLEPARGAYDWKLLDGAVEAARHKGRTYKLMFKPGTDTPDWVYAKSADGSPGSAVFETIGPNPNREGTYQKPVRIPIPWDPAYLREFERFIRAAGERYASDPLCVAVAITGANFQSAEAHLPKNPKDREKWKALEYRDKLSKAYERYIDIFAGAFPRQQLCLHLSVAVDAKDGVLEEAVDYGVQRHPDRFTLQNCQLSGRGDNTRLFSYPLTQKYAGKVHVGYQSLAALGEGPAGARMGNSQKAVENYVRGHGEYWELWDANGRDAVLCKWLLDEITRARIAAPGNVK